MRHRLYHDMFMTILKLGSSYLTSVPIYLYDYDGNVYMDT